jgi:hypothetical protein
MLIYFLMIEPEAWLRGKSSYGGASEKPNLLYHICDRVVDRSTVILSDRIESGRSLALLE